MAENATEIAAFRIAVFKLFTTSPDSNVKQVQKALYYRGVGQPVAH